MPNLFDDRKYCKGNCGTILSDNSYQPHRKYCDACNEVKDYVRCGKSQEKYRTKYLVKDAQRRKERKLNA